MKAPSALVGHFRARASVRVSMICTSAPSTAAAAGIHHQAVDRAGRAALPVRPDSGQHAAKNTAASKSRSHECPA